jgi:hypothetical protein
MCPTCIASAGVVVGSALSSGGLTALAMKVLRKKEEDHEGHEVGRRRTR